MMSSVLAAIGDERLWQTNPVYCVETLLETWGRTDAGLGEGLSSATTTDRRLGRSRNPPSPAARRRWRDRAPIDPLGRRGGADEPEYPCPGVVGLVVDRVTDDAWVVPLQVEASREWSTDSTLPFTSTGLQDLLIRLLRAAGLPSSRAVPERFAFKIRDLLGHPSAGPSMHVAGVLAVVRAANRCPPLLSRACAVLQAEGDRLAPVASVRLKLTAFLRECGRGTLLIRHRDCTEAAAIRRRVRSMLGGGFSRGLRRASGPRAAAPRLPRRIAARSRPTSTWSICASAGWRCPNTDMKRL